MVFIRAGFQFAAPVEIDHHQPGTFVLHFFHFRQQEVWGASFQHVDAYQAHRDPFDGDQLAFFIAEGHDAVVSQVFESIPETVAAVVVAVVIGQGGGFHAAVLQQLHISRVSPEGEGLLLPFSPGGKRPFQVHHRQVVVGKNGLHTGQEYGTVSACCIPGGRKSPFIAETFFRTQGAVSSSADRQGGDGVLRRLGSRSRRHGGLKCCRRRSRGRNSGLCNVCRIQCWRSRLGSGGRARCRRGGRSSSLGLRHRLSDCKSCRRS